MMTLRTVVPLFRVANVERSLDWYREVLGFEADPFPETPPYAFAILRHGQAELMLRAAPGEKRPAGFNRGWDAYLRLEGNSIRRLFAALSGKADILRPLQRMPYGLVEFDLRDPDGYVLCF